MSILLGIIILVQLVLLVGCVIKITSTIATLNLMIELNQSLEESRCRMQALVYRKFNYHVPMSDKYLSLAELKFEKGIN